MANKPLLSVVCVTYNHEPYIAQAIESFLMQKVSFPIEIIIGEDCSTDRTRQICVEYQKKYPDKICLILSEQNVGAAKNFLQTVQAVNGKYIAYCDGDDYWTDPDKLQKQVDFLENNPAYASCSHQVKTIFDGPTGVRDLKNFYPNPIIDASFDDLVARRLFIGLNSYMCRKEAILSLPDWVHKLQRSTHHAIVFLVAMQGLNRHFMDVMAVKRRNSGGVTQSINWKKISKIKHRILMYEKLREHLHNKKDYVLLPVILRWHRKQIIRELMNFHIVSIIRDLYKYTLIFKENIRVQRTYAKSGVIKK